MTDRQKKFADSLFDGIGMIDDRLIASAERAPVCNGSRIALRRMLIAACIVLLAVCITVASWTVASRKNDSNSKGDAAHQTETAGEHTLDAVLLSVKNLNGKTECAEEKINLFSGTASIIWQYEGSDGYYVQHIGNSQALYKKVEMLNGTSSPLTPQNASEIRCKVWISFGDGTVISPYLTQSAGNTGYGRLFDYDPEIEPSADFAQYISYLLS